MKAKFVIVTVARGIVEKTPLARMLHEVEVLRMVHGAPNVEVADALPDVPLVEVDAADEFSRLSMLYGKDNEGGVPFVERAFGRFDPAKFTQACEALLPAPAAKTKAAPVAG